MLTKIEHLRAETQAAIGEIIELNTQTLIAKWVARVHEEQPTAARVHHIVLLDHMPDFLAHLGGRWPQPVMNPRVSGKRQVNTATSVGTQVVSN